MTTLFANIANDAKFNSPSKRNSVLDVGNALDDDEEGSLIRLNKVEAKSA